MAETNSRFYEFGQFQLDAHRRVLRKNGAHIHLTPRAFDLLCVMVENAPRILDHDELLERVWPGTFVEQGNLKKAVSALRRALGETPDANEFIITVPRRGYRFGPGVRTLPDDAVLIRQTMGEIVIEEVIDDGLPGPAAKPVAQLKPAAGRGMSRAFFTAAAILVLVVVAIAAWPYLHTGPLRFSADKVNITRLMSGAYVVSGAISADGKFMVYAVARGAEKSLWVRQVAMESGVQIVPPVKASFWDAAFTPDASLIYYTLHSEDEPQINGLYRLAALGGTPQRLSKENFIGLKFSPDGKSMAAYRTVNIDGGEQQELLTMGVDAADPVRVITLPVNSLFRGIAWSPDGTSFLYGVKRQAVNERPVYYAAEVQAGGGVEKILMPEQDQNILLIEEWLPDHKSFLLRQREPRSEAFQIWQYFPATGEGVRVTNDDYSYNVLTPAQDGKTLGAFRNFAMDSVRVTDDPKSGFNQIATGVNSLFRMDWTADGKLVFSLNENSREFVAISDADGNGRRLLTGGTDGVILNPRVAGDGRTITFISDRSGGRQVWRIDSDGTNVNQIPTSTGVSEAKLLADSQTLVYLTYVRASSVWCLFKRTADGREIRLTETDTQEWDLSPDEKYLAVYTPDAKTGKRHISIIELETGRETVSLSAENITCLRWTRAGDALNYIRVAGDRYEIVNQPLRDGSESVLTSITGEIITNFSWSRDGKHLAVSQGRLSSEAVLIRSDAK